MVAFLRYIIYVTTDFKGETVENLCVDNMYLFNVGINASIIMYRPFEVKLQKTQLTVLPQIMVGLA